ncbi:unnamed protein product, partial [Protopolystoma xenopodis]
RLLILEDDHSESAKRLEEKFEELESQKRDIEIKHRKAKEHATRLEEKEAELRKELNQIHERYTELLRTHVDHVERYQRSLKNDSIHIQDSNPKNQQSFCLLDPSLPDFESSNRHDLPISDVFVPDYTFSAPITQAGIKLY